MTNTSQKLSDRITSVDRISNFPDEVLCHILSFLNTKQALLTSFLSKRWRFLWAYMDTIDIQIKKPGSKLQFEKHVNRVLQLHRGLTIKRMRLVCYGRECNNHDIVKWIQTGNSKKIETLHLCFGNMYRKWTLCLFRSQTLVELNLEFADITNINISTAPFFPSLKKLRLHRPYCKKDSLTRLISGCSILEYFELDSIDTYGYKYYEPMEAYISLATLKTVNLYYVLSCSVNPMFVLNTPALEVLKTRGSPDLELLEESSMPSLHEADISIRLSELDDNSNSDSWLKLLQFLYNVSALRCEVENYNRSSNKSNLHAYFNNFTRLEIVDGQFGLDLLRIFIEKSINLKDITLERGSFLKESGVIWEEPQHVPVCLLSSLQSVSIYGYQNEEEEEVESMIKYILENAEVLKRMEIVKSLKVKTNDEFNLHMFQKISMFPRASRKCEISIN